MRLKIGILGHKFKEHGRRRLIEEFRLLGHEAVKLDIDKLCLTIDKKLSGFQNNTKLDDLDVVLPRFGTHNYNFGLLVMRHIKIMGIPAVNNYNSITLCQDKYLTSLAFKKHNIPQPGSYIASSAPSALKVVKGLKNPVIFKLLKGGKGTGVALINSITEAEDWFSTLRKVGRLIYIQEYIPHELNEDYRLFVVGDKVVGAMKRISMHGWKTNFSLGNKIESMKPSKELVRLALRAAKAVDVDICGVDIMKGISGNQVIEINQHPGFQGLEKATGKNIAREIAKFTIERAKKYRLKKELSAGLVKSKQVELPLQKKKSFLQSVVFEQVKLRKKNLDLKNLKKLK